jgi:hypothetical protein
LLAVILRDPDWFKILGVGFLSDVGGEGEEEIVIVIVVIPIGTFPSSCLNDAPCVLAIIDLLPKINHGSVMEAGLGWSFTLRPCITPIVRWASGLLHLLFDVATRGLQALGLPWPTGLSWLCWLWQNRLNYSGSRALVIAI